MTRRQETGALVAMAFLGVVTAAWWALALWPVRSDAATWLVRARAVCFDVGPSGLPDAAGWLLLVGQPLGMLTALVAIWGAALRSGLGRIASRRSGRALLVACGLALGLGLVAAGARIASAREDMAPFALGAVPPPDLPRLDRAAPELGLVDQHGDRLDLAALRGRPALVTFAFAHCETVCPAVVRQALAAQRRVREHRGDAGAPRVVVVTLDPWRDTPSRLAALASGYGLGADGFVLSGDVADVNALLDRWNVARGRDPRTGDLVHAPLVYVLDAAGRIAFASSGGTDALVELIERS